MSRTEREGKRIKHIKNPDLAMQEAQDMVKRFHGRGARGVIDIVETDEYDDTLPVLGQLLELNIMIDEGRAFVPIVFCKMQGKFPKMPLEDMIQVCCGVDGKNIYFKGGDQELDIGELASKGVYQELEGNGNGSLKDLCIVGGVWSIVYFTDKHHLQGPKYQSKGAPYEHEFGENDGEQPVLVYDSKNKRMSLSGGSYEVRDEGIWN